MSDYFAILTCRNSQGSIRSAIVSILKQTIVPEYIIVINDGSTDKTIDILQEIRSTRPSIHVIVHPDWGYDIKRVVLNWNEAIRFSKERNLKRTKYHLIATDDTEYSPDYVETLVHSMDSDEKIAIASGTYSEHIPVMPHGAGRLVRNSFLEDSMWRGFYPEKMGYESAVLYEADRCGYNHMVLSNARFKHKRPLGQSHKFYEFGASMQTLGYHPLFALSRILKYFVTGEVTGRIGALYMLYYYLSYQPKFEGYDSLYDERIRNYIRTYQLKRLRNIIANSGKENA
ncbi:MAG: glycosyltransferase family A protein [Nitrososphaeraceae archaeon]